jgi:hypothetical protein
MSTPAETTAIIGSGLTKLQELCGSTAASKGFHDDRPNLKDFFGLDWAKYPAALANWQGNKLLLVVSEVIGAHAEIRTGHAADETYYPQPPLPSSLVAEVGVAKARELINADCLAKPKKPEGVPSEIADAVIRCFDFAYTEGFSLADIIIEKLQYNATRERLHGKRF